MVTADQRIKEFLSKPYDEKLKISMNIITNLKDRGNVQAQEIFDIISKMDEIPEKIINSIYKDFCDSVERIKQEKVEGELAHFGKVKNYMEELRDMESKEREKEDLDLLLDDL